MEHPPGSPGPRQVLMTHGWHWTVMVTARSTTEPSCLATLPLNLFQPQDNKEMDSLHLRNTTKPLTEEIMMAKSRVLTLFLHLSVYGRTSIIMAYQKHQS